ncbi:MAG: Rossmann fold domain-containing protein [Alteraurantiacibacter sp.]
MSATIIAARGLPDAPLDAAAAFAERHLAEARTALPRDVVLLFDPADHTHKAWRRATVQELAREAAPGRVNAVVGSDEGAIAEVIAYLARAPGVTGQLLATNGQGET